MTEEAIEGLHRRMGRLERKQIEAWQRMTGAQRLDLAFQAYQFALDAVRLTERRLHPDLTPEELNWRIVRRMQGKDFQRNLSCPLRDTTPYENAVISRT